MPSERFLKVRVTLNGRPIRTQVFNKDEIHVGRDPKADIFLDNPGISREHLCIVTTADGNYEVQDRGSANGTLLNDAPVKHQLLRDNDVIRAGKFSLWVTYERDRRGHENGAEGHEAAVEDGTMVLSASELEHVIHRARSADAVVGQFPDSEPEALVPVASAPVAKGGVWTRPVHSGVLAAFAIGAAIGVGAVIYWTQLLRP